MIRRTVCGVFAAGLLACTGSAAQAMTADGAVITNYATITAYWRSTGPGYAQRYMVSYGATLGAVVTNPCATVHKAVSPSLQTPGGTLTYTICIVSCAVLSSSWNVVAMDPLPANVSYAGPSLSSWSPLGSSWSLQHSADGTTWTGSPSEPATGQSAPCYMRWTINVLGPGRSACVSYKATVQ